MHYPLNLLVGWSGFLGGALSGALGAAIADIRAWQSWEDARFQLGVASWRWLQGAILGAVGAAGLGAVIG